MYRVILLLVGWQVMVAAPLSAAETLRWSLKKGQLLRLNVDQKFESETTIRKTKLKMTLDMGFELDWLVKEVDAKGDARIEQSFSRLRLKMDSPDTAAIEFDSASQVELKGPAKQMAESMAPLLGMKFHVLMDNVGTIKDVTLPSDAGKINALPPQIKKLFTKDGLKATLQQSSLALPQKPVEKGEFWSRQATAPTRLGSMTTKSRYTYDGAVEAEGRTVAKISVGAVVELTPRKTVGNSFRIKNQDYHGTIYFDSPAGRLNQSVSEQTLVTETRKKDLVLETSTKTTMRLRIRELKPGK